MAKNLVIHTAFLGDVLLGIPFLKRIKSISSDPLALVVRQGVGNFFLKTQVVDEVYEIKKGDRASYRSVVRQLRGQELNHVFVPHQSVRTHFFLAQLKAQTKIGYSQFWNRLFFDRLVRRDPSLPEPLRQLSLLKSLDPSLDPLLESYRRENRAYTLGTNNQMSLPPPWASMSLKEKLLADRGTWSRWLEKSGFESLREKEWVLVFPGSVWATKRWTEEGFVKVSQEMQNQGRQVFFMGAPEEKALCEKLSRQVMGSQVLAGMTSIYESALILARAALVIGNDSASMHLASVAEAPLISVFGPTVIEFGFRPWSAKAFLVQNQDLSCRPCGPHGHRECPLKHHLCMKEISAEKVLEVASKTR